MSVREAHRPREVPIRLVMCARPSVVCLTLTRVSTDQGPPTNDRVPTAAKALAAVLLVVLVVHFGITFLWNSQPNPATDVVGDQVDDYIEPLFEQHWRLFAPNPVNAENELLVRADVRNPETGEFETTPWTSATQREWSLVEGNPFPSRASRLTTNLHRRLEVAWEALDDDQRQVVTVDFFAMDDDWSELVNALKDEQDATATAIETYIRAERVATAYATQFAKAAWGKDVTSVQVRLRSTPVPRWKDRFGEPDPDAAVVTEFGWRPVVVTDEQDEKAFGEALDRMSAK